MILLNRMHRSPTATGIAQFSPAPNSNGREINDLVVKRWTLIDALSRSVSRQNDFECIRRRPCEACDLMTTLYDEYCSLGCCGTLRLKPHQVQLLEELYDTDHLILDLTDGDTDWLHNPGPPCTSRLLPKGFR